MNTDPRERLVDVLATGSLEELSTLLFLIHLQSTRPKTHEASPDLNDQAGSASIDEIAKSSGT